MEDGFAEDELDGFGESRGVGAWDFVGGGEGMNAGVMEGLVNIYIAKAGDQALIEQSNFYGAFCVLEEGCQTRGTKR